MGTHSSADTFRVQCSLSTPSRCGRSGMHNIRPAEAFNLARETPNFVYFASFLEKTPFECVKTYHLWPLDVSKNFFGPL